MRKQIVSILLAWAVVASSTCALWAQYQQPENKSVPLMLRKKKFAGSAAITWTVLQGVFISSGANCYQSSATSNCSLHCTVAASSCTIQFTTRTTVHTALAFYIITDGNTATISGGYTCTNSGGCDSGNAIDTLSLCSSSGCHITNGSGGSNDNLDGAYIANGAGGATYATVNLSGDSGGTWLSVGVVEFKRSSGVPTFDTYATADSSSCGTTCTLASFSSLHGDDAVIQFDDTYNQFTTNPTSPYQYVGASSCGGESIGSCYVGALGTSSTSAPTVTQSPAGYMSITAMAFY